MADHGGLAVSALHDALTEYLATRRALGTQLMWPESSLRGFVVFVEAEGAEFVTTELQSSCGFGLRSLGQAGFLLDRSDDRSPLN